MKTKVILGAAGVLALIVIGQGMHIVKLRSELALAERNLVTAVKATEARVRDEIDDWLEYARGGASGALGDTLADLELTNQGLGSTVVELSGLKRKVARYEDAWNQMKSYHALPPEAEVLIRGRVRKVFADSVALDIPRPNGEAAGAAWTVSLISHAMHDGANWVQLGMCDIAGPEVKGLGIGDEVEAIGISRQWVTHTNLGGHLIQLPKYKVKVLRQL